MINEAGKSWTFDQYVMSCYTQAISGPLYFDTSYTIAQTNGEEAPGFVTLDTENLEVFAYSLDSNDLGIYELQITAWALGEARNTEQVFTLVVT